MIDLLHRPIRVLVLPAVLWGASIALAPTAHAVPPNLVGNPSFETGTSGWNVYNGSLIEPVSGGADGAYALYVQGEDNLTTFGINDSPNWIATIRAVGSRYRFTALVRSENSTGSARLQIREYKDGTQRGSSVKTPLVPLTAEWQAITGDYVATTPGATLDFQILDVPLEENESFLIDHVSIIEVFPDAPPVVTVDSLVTVEEAETFGLQVTAQDPDGEPIMSLAADLSALPAGAHASFTPDPTNSSGTLEWTPTFDDAGGPYVVRFFAGNSLAGIATTRITVLNVDRPPVLEAPAEIVTRDSTELVIEITAVDPDGDPIDLVADLGQLPAGHGATFTTSGAGDEATLRWRPALGASGQYPVRLVASNALADTTVMTIAVMRIEHSPALQGPATIHVREGQTIDLPILAQDPDGDAFVSLSAGLAALPSGSGAAFTTAPNHASGRFTWSPGYFHAGTYDVVFDAASGAGVAARTVTSHLRIEVENLDRAPVVTAPATVTVFENQPLTIDFTAADPDSEAIAFLFADLTTLPAGHSASFVVSGNQRAARLTWTPSHAEIGSYPITVDAENALAGSAATTIVVRPPNRPPLASLVVSPAVTSAPALVTANASGSTDPEDPIVSYRFDFGDGIVVGPQSSPIASAMIAGATVREVQVIVTDAFGASDTAGARVASHLGNVCTNPSFENTTTGWIGYGGATLARVSGAGRTGTWAYRATRTAGAAWGFNDSPDWVPLTAGPGRTYRVIAWVRSLADHGQATLRVQEFLGTAQKGVARTSAPVTLSDQWRMLSVDYVVTAVGTRLDLKVLDDSQSTGASFLLDDVQVLLLPLGDQPPLVSAPASVTAIAGQPLTITIATADPDGQPLAAVTANLAALPPGNDAHWAPESGGSGGTLTWTPRAADVGPVPYVVTITAANALATTAPIEIVVAPAPLPNLCGNPGFESNASGWMAYGSGTSITRVNGGRSGQFAAQLTHPSSTGWGLNDQLDIVSNVVAPGRTYRFSAWVRSPVSAGKVRMRVQEFLGTTQRGTTAETPEVTLTHQWQRLALSYTATTAGARLDMKIVDAPVAIGESFLVDDVEVCAMPAGDRPAAMSVPTAIVVPRQQPMTVCVTAADPDGDAIATLTADLTGLPAGHNATFTPGPGNRTGILSWTPGAADARATPYVVTFTAGNQKNAIASTAITVTAMSYPNLCANPGFESGTTGWGRYGQATLTRIAGGHSGGYALRMRTAGASSFGIDDTPNVVASVPAAGERYRFSAWVRSDSSGSPVRLRIYEFAGDVQLGATTLSYEVPVASTWQLVTVDHTALGAGSTLSLRVTMSPETAGQSFLVDDVVVQRLPAGAALIAAAPSETEAADAAVDSLATESSDVGLAFSASVAPNPMRGATLLRFSLPQAGPVKAELFDAAGRRVRTLLHETLVQPGHHTIDLRSREAGLGAGVYFYRVDAGASGARSGRLVVLE